jgi:hypothetical protein
MKRQREQAKRDKKAAKAERREERKNAPEGVSETADEFESADVAENIPPHEGA